MRVLLYACANQLRAIAMLQQRSQESTATSDLSAINNHLEKGNTPVVITALRAFLSTLQNAAQEISGRQ